MDYRPQLDALRALAVIGVLFTHFWIDSSNAGPVGVRLFFVLSGFLITSLLLERLPLLVFYSRRAFRLLPAFYLALAFGLAINLYQVRATWAWHATLLTNVLFFLKQSYEGPWATDHLWSLNVEWQFYLVWPFVIKLTPRRLLPCIFIAVFAVGALYRPYFPEDLMATLPFASMDALAAGALLALYSGSASLVYAAGFVAAPLAVWGLFEDNLVTRLGCVVAFTALVLAGWRGDLKLLEHRFLVQLGKISYGVYLYHLFIWGTLYPMIHRLERGPTLFFVLSAITISVACVSYRYFEAPLRSWGRRYFEPAVSRV